MTVRPVALVTGSTGALGMAIVRRLAAEGYDLVLHHQDERSAPLAAELVAEFAALGVSAVPVAADLLDTTQIGAMFSQVKGKFGRIDLLVNNAGITKDQLLVRMREEDFDQVLAVNLKAAFLCTQQAALQMMRQRNGSIINIASVAGQLGTYGQANYAASKAGLIALTKTSARELAARGVTVNAVAPGFIEAGLTTKLSNEQRQAYVEQVPLKRAGTADDVANAVAFLADSRSRYITGQVIAVNGGLHM